MERYKCRFCLKTFNNGKALDGHMISHMLNFSSSSSSSKRDSYELALEEEEEEEEEKLPSQLNESDPSSSSSSSSSDSEIETESLRINPTGKRSKRIRKLGSFDFDVKKLKTSQLGDTVTETEHHSSASDTTTEEDLAFCLIMLSRDKWMQHNNKKKTKQEEEDETEEQKSSKNRGGGGGRRRDRFKCETCDKVFKSYQALGGHRSSHKKNKTFTTTTTTKMKTEYVNGVIMEEKRIHQCPICYRVFSSGQALGGHKRSHGRGFSVNQIIEEEVRVKQRMIDLNQLPATNEEEEDDDDETSLVFDEKGNNRLCV
ncbi:unnamed protein product [Cochlearia groenlandica]